MLVVIAIVTVACATTSKKGAALPTYPDQLTEEAKQSFYHAESLYNAHDFVNAEKAYQEFIQNHGYNSLTDQAYFILGEIAFKRNDFNTSAAQYEQAFSRVYSPKISPKAQYQGALAHFKMDKPSRSLEILSPMKREDMNSQLRFEGDSLAIQSCKALGYPSSYSIVWYLLLLDDYHSVWGSLEEAGENITSVPRYEVNEKIKEWIEDSSVTVESIKKLPIDYMKGKLSYAYVSY
ncbi:hypothetical protein KKA47_04265, partial [bacterium]|nr:hypothetical protein [bacterium]